MQRRRNRAQRSVVVITTALAAATVGYLLGSLVAGFHVPGAVLAIALAASWLCIGALVLLPGAEEPIATSDAAVLDDAASEIVVPAPRSSTATPAPAIATTAFARDLDPVSGLLRYQPTRDDRYVTRTDVRPGAVVVVEIVDHVTAMAISPAVADRLVADAAARVLETASTYGAVVRRLHGPQMALLLPGLDEPALIGLARMLHDGTATGWVPAAVLRDGSQPVRLVAGIAVATDESEDVLALIRSATAAVAQAKRQGSEAPVVFHDRLADEARERLAVGRALRTAIDERNISLVYQPQVDLVDGSLLGVEVLARWNDPVLGAIAPDRFVRIAAEIGMSWQLDRLVFEKAFAQLGDWDAAGVTVPRIFVNVSPETIAEGRRVGLRNLLAAYSVSPERVTVELVNCGLLDGELGLESVQRYRDLGLQVTLDDFGADESSFGQLTALPVTGLKIHRSLLAGDGDAAALGAIIEAGTSLGLAVGAVGVETEVQRDLLRGLGCAAGQGYLYAAPLGPAELVEWLRVPDLVG